MVRMATRICPVPHLLVGDEPEIRDKGLEFHRRIEDPHRTQFDAVGEGLLDHVWRDGEDDGVVFVRLRCHRELAHHGRGEYGVVLLLLPHIDEHSVSGFYPGDDVFTALGYAPDMLFSDHVSVCPVGYCKPSCHGGVFAEKRYKGCSVSQKHFFDVSPLFLEEDMVGVVICGRCRFEYGVDVRAGCDRDDVGVKDEIGFAGLVDDLALEVFDVVAELNFVIIESVHEVGQALGIGKDHPLRVCGSVLHPENEVGVEPRVFGESNTSLWQVTQQEEFVVIEELHIFFIFDKGPEIPDKLLFTFVETFG